MRSDVGVTLRIAAATWLAMMPFAAGAEELSDLHVVEARLFDPAEGEAPQLLARLDEVGRLRFANWTRRHVGEIVDNLVDGRVVSTVKILTPINGGSIAVLGLAAEQIEALVPRLLDGR